MADIDLLMLGLVLILTPLSLFLARFIAQKSYHLYQNQTKSRGQQTQYIEEMIRQEVYSTPSMRKIWLLTLSRRLMILMLITHKELFSILQRLIRQRVSLIA